jgi:hypothetical protein
MPQKLARTEQAKPENLLKNKAFQQNAYFIGAGGYFSLKSQKSAYLT